MRMKHLLWLLFISLPAWAQTQYKYPVPKDPVNVPIQNALGLPFAYQATLTTTAYVKISDLSLSGNNSGRQYRAVCAYNPSTTESAILCFGTSSACSTDMMIVPPAFGLCLDNIYAGFFNDITAVWGKLSAAGSSDVQVNIW